MMTDDWKISVVIPVYNGAMFISEAIKSVLDQSYPAMEIIVIDDGSTDDTAEIVQQFSDPVHYVQQLNSGTSAARNKGVSLAKGELLAFLDADDRWPAYKLERQVDTLRDDPGLDLIWGNVMEFRDHAPATTADAVPGHHPGTMLIRREAFNAIGEFSVDFQQAEVVEWMSRVLQSNVKQHMLPEVLMYRRIHAANKGRSNPGSQQEYLQVLKRHLDMKRVN